jgi:hypothetical protein
MTTSDFKHDPINLEDGITASVSATAEFVTFSATTENGTLAGDLNMQPDDACLLGCYLMQAAAECRVLRAQ